jgi:hypothetical protein
VPSYLDGVTVCLLKKRGYKQRWADFVDVKGPCTEPVPAGANVVLRGVPPMAELVLTAKKQGYLPRTIAVTTGQWDTDLTIHTGQLSKLHLLSTESAAFVFPGADLERGQVIVFMESLEMTWPEGGTSPNFSWSLLSDVGVSLTPDGGQEARYFNGRSLVGAAQTGPGDNQQFADAVLTNLREGEYVVRASPNVESGSAIAASGFRDDLPDEVRVPVLDGFFTEAGLAVGCPHPEPGDPHRCAPSADAGQP